MESPKYDEHGGIVNSNQRLDQSVSLRGKEKNNYNFWERILIRYCRKVNYLLDDQGKYNCRLSSASIIRLGITNRCSARCFYCPREIIHEKGSGYMDWELFASIIAWAAKNKIKTIGFALWGEPTLHPDLLRMLSLIRGKGMNIRISTNAIVLNPALADKIFEYPIEAIEISMDGFTSEEYYKGKQVDQFETARKNINYLINLAKEKKLPTLFNIHTVDVGQLSFLNRLNYIRYWTKKLKGLNFETSFIYEPHNWAGARNNLQSRLNWLDRQLAKVSFKKPCVYVKGININWNGDVYVCSSDLSAQSFLGNLKEASLAELYQHPKRLIALTENETGNFAQTNCGVCNVNTVKPLFYLKKIIINKIMSAL